MVQIINNSNELIEYLDELTNEKRIEVYFEVYKKIINQF
jgi:hypothetical protein